MKRLIMSFVYLKIVIIYCNDILVIYFITATSPQFDNMIYLFDNQWQHVGSIWIICFVLRKMNANMPCYCATDSNTLKRILFSMPKRFHEHQHKNRYIHHFNTYLYTLYLWNNVCYAYLAMSFTKVYSWKTKANM